MNEKHMVKFVWASKALLLAVLLYVAFEVAMNCLHLGAVIDPATARGEQRAADKQVGVPQTRSPSDYTTIVERNLFTEGNDAGNPPAATGHSQALDPVASTEEIGLRLVGSIAGGPVASRAVIQNTKNNTTGSYRIGDAVASATVETIQRDAVILQYQGKPLVLKLRAGRPENGGQETGNARLKPQKAGQMADGRSQPSSVVDAPSSESSRVGYVAEVFRKATIEPYVKDNRTEGLRIGGLDQIPMAQVLGLQNGDIVQSVNGQPLSSKQKAFQVLMKAKTQSKLSIQLLRDGKSKDLSFDL
jgi:type II secretion system protein C